MALKPAFHARYECMIVLLPHAMLCDAAGETREDAAASALCHYAAAMRASTPCQRPPTTTRRDINMVRDRWRYFSSFFPSLLLFLSLVSNSLILFPPHADELFTVFVVRVACTHSRRHCGVERERQRRVERYRRHAFSLRIETCHTCCWLIGNILPFRPLRFPTLA